MKLKFINEIKKLESPAKVVKLFSNNEINKLIDLYNSLPITVHNKKQNVIKKRWLKNYNKELDSLYLSKLNEVLGDFKMDNLKSESGEDFFGLIQESIGPIGLHSDGGFDENSIIYKQVLVPLTSQGETVIFENRWYGGSTSFTINEDELKIIPSKKGQNIRTSEHLKIYSKDKFDKTFHKKYLVHENINNLKGLKVQMVYNWKIGEVLIFDRTHLHASSSNIINSKIGIATFTKK